MEFYSKHQVYFLIFGYSALVAAVFRLTYEYFDTPGSSGTKRFLSDPDSVTGGCGCAAFVFGFLLLGLFNLIFQ